MTILHGNNHLPEFPPGKRLRHSAVSSDIFCNKEGFWFRAVKGLEIDPKSDVDFPNGFKKYSLLKPKLKKKNSTFLPPQLYYGPGQPASHSLRDWRQKRFIF